MKKTGKENLLYTVSILLGMCGFMSANAKSDVTFYQDVKPIMDTSCMGCHSEKGVSFSFEDAENTYLMKHAIASAVLEKRMPPWLAEAGHQHYIDDISLSKQELTTFKRWAATGYLKGKKKEENKTLTKNTSAVFKGKHGFLFLNGASILPNQNQKDDYRCFVVDWPESDQKYITGFKALPGNTKVAHHLVVFLASPEIAAMYREMHNEVDGKGYPCYSSSVTEKLSSKKYRNEFESKYPGRLKKMYEQSHWLAHWAPGMDGYNFPDDTGIPVKPGSVLIVQMHYYSAFAPGEKDTNSFIEVAVKDHVLKPAIYIPLHDGQWLASKDNQSMVIPAGEMGQYTTERNFEHLSQRLGKFIGRNPEDIKGIELHAANLHMHSYGHSGEVSLISPQGRVETLLSIPKWDLHWQRDFTFLNPKVITSKNFAKARLKVNCRYANYSNGPVYGGFGSDDEMCFNFSYISVSE